MRDGALIAPLYGFLLWVAKVDQSTKKSMASSNLLGRFKSGFFYLQTMLMCSSSVFLNDFVDLVRSVRIRLDHAMTCSWTADSIQNLARFFLHLLSKSHLKDIIELSDLQKRRGGTLAFRSLQNPEEDLKIKPAVIPDPVVLIRGRRFVATPQQYIPKLIQQLY